ncbi:MAG: MarR family transcriptional regulator [Acidimicrobiales bacterium]|nr:MarR family transcriptional regulator [Acidimicrobiales bacterium]
MALGLSSAPSAPADLRPAPGPEESLVLEALDWEPATFDDLCARSGRTPGQVSVALARLQAGGWVGERAGWWERIT